MNRQGLAYPPHRLSLVRDAIGVVLRRLATLPISSQVDDLRQRLRNQLHEANAWTIAPPTAKDEQSFMVRLVALHVAAVKLEQQRA